MCKPVWESLDLGWLGIKIAERTDDIESVYLIKNDSTVPPLPKRDGYWDNAHVLPEVWRNDTRIVFRTKSALCMWAYAMSLEGARKALSAMSLQGGDGRQVDVECSRLNEDKNITSYSIYPPLFASHRFAGSRSRDSNIKNFPTEETHPELTHDIVYSTIMNIPKLVSGAEEVDSQWPNDTEPTRRLDESYTEQVTRELKAVQLPLLPTLDIRGITGWGQLDWEKYSILEKSQ